MVTRDFDAMLSEKAGVRPTFRVGGQEFTAKAKIPYKRFRAFLESLDGEDVDEAAKFEDFMQLALVRDDRERFRQLLDADGDDDDEDVVAIGQVGQITEWLIEHYTGKAAPNSDSSSDGSAPTGAPGNVVSLNPRTNAG